MLRETIAKLREPLDRERAQEFINSAVPGGTAAHFQALTGQALTAIENGSDLVPINCEFLLQRLNDIWKIYPRQDLPSRQRIYDATIRLLEQLEDTLDSAPISEGGLRLPEPEKPAKKTSETKKKKAPVIDESTLDSNIIYLKGIGPNRAKTLAKLGIHTVSDLIQHFPARYEDRRTVKSVGDLIPGEKDSFVCEVLFPGETRKMGHRSITRIRAGDESGRIDLQWWNQPFRENQLKVGTRLFVYGKIGEFNGTLQIDAPEFEIVGAEDGSQIGRIVPVYPATEGLYQSNLRRAISDALEKHADSLEEMLSDEVRDQFGLMERLPALREIHSPTDWESKEVARYRLVFEELFLLQVALAQKKHAAHLEESGIRHVVSDEEIKKFVRALPFKLTGAQKRAMNEIRRDLKAPRPMNRLLHGDVGSGKTMVAAFALWSAWK